MYKIVKVHVQMHELVHHKILNEHVVGDSNRQALGQDYGSSGSVECSNRSKV
jgi:hypothetical protein